MTGEPRPDHPRAVRIGEADVRRLEAATQAFRALDYRHGGGSCRDAVEALVPYAELMLLGVVREPALPRLCTAVADLHNLVGWTSFDEGRPGAALAAFGRALELATTAGNDELLANICYRIGRVHLHYDAVDEAVNHFERGEAAARRAGSLHTRSILSANLAWAEAKQGAVSAALTRLRAARDEFAAASEAAPPPWAAFFGETDLAAMAGTVHTELAQVVDVRHAGEAIAALIPATDGYERAMTRSRALTRIWLATAHALAGDLDEAARVGGAAIEVATELQSERTKQRMAPLTAAAGRFPGNADAREILERVDRLRGVAGPEQVTLP
jgi:tetratricopeptide (TPR) repeat protein